MHVALFASRGNGVIILNFISDVLANLFLSGMFVRRQVKIAPNRLIVVELTHWLLNCMD